MKKMLPYLIGVLIGLFLGNVPAVKGFLSKIPVLGSLLGGGSTVIPPKQNQTSTNQNPK